MERALTTYQTNFVEYAVTNEPRYKIAYENAQESLEAIIANAESRKPENVKKMHDVSNSMNQRSVTSSPTPVASMTWKYTALAVLGALTIGLSMF